MASIMLKEARQLAMHVGGHHKELIDALVDRLEKWESVFGHLGEPDEVGNEWHALSDRLETVKTAWKEADKACRDLTEKVIPNIRAELEAAEKRLHEVAVACAEAESEAVEQARLNGAGGERELALMAKLEVAEKERDALRARIEAMEQQVPICRAEDLRHAEILLPSLGLMPEDKLYALPGAKTVLRVPDAVTAALDTLDDYIARIEGNDRGACNHINLLRRYLLDATDVGENK